MKKLFALVLSAVLVFSLLAGCGKAGENKNKSDEKTIVIGATSTPHGEILEHVKGALKEKGYTLEIKIFNDYVTPNTALNDGTLDANYFQHKPYLDSFNKSNKTDLISAAAIHYEPFALYGNGVKSVKDVKKGAKIIIPNDDSNETRALLLLQQEGLIKLKDGVKATDSVTKLDVVDDGGYDITEVEADTVPAQFNNSNDGSLAVINGNYALAAGLKIADALATESVEGDAAQTYANIIAVKKGDESSDKIKALCEVLTTDDVKSFLLDKYNGAVVAIF